MQIFTIESKDNSKNIVVFWVFESIKYRVLVLKTYISWYINIVYNDKNLRNFKDNFQICDILGKSWSNKINILFLGFTKSHFKNLFTIMNNNDKQIG